MKSLSFQQFYFKLYFIATLTGNTLRLFRFMYFNNVLGGNQAIFRIFSQLMRIKINK